MSVVQKQRVLHLYRHSLKTILNWAVRREVFWSEVRANLCHDPFLLQIKLLHILTIGCLQAASLRKVFESNASVVRSKFNCL